MRHRNFARGETMPAITTGGDSFVRASPPMCFNPIPIPILELDCDMALPPVTFNQTRIRVWNANQKIVFQISPFWNANS